MERVLISKLEMETKNSMEIKMSSFQSRNHPEVDKMFSLLYYYFLRLFICYAANFHASQSRLDLALDFVKKL